jgi:hypothetical protein
MRAMKKAKKPAVTLRNLPPQLARLVERRARERSMSLNKAVISLLEEAAGTGLRPGKKRVYHDLDGLAGKWSVREASAFEAALAEQRGIDQEHWR